MLLEKEILHRMIKEAKISFPQEKEINPLTSIEIEAERNLDVYIRKILELQRRSKLIGQLQVWSASSSPLLSVALMEIAHRILYPTSNVIFPRQTLLKCLWISYEKQQISEYVRILNICKQTFQPPEGTAVAPTSSDLKSSSSEGIRKEPSKENGSLLTSSDLNFLDKLFFQYSFDDKVTLSSSTPSSSDVVKKEILKMIDTYKREFYDRLPPSQKSYVKLSEKPYYIASFLLLAEHFQVKVEKLRVVEMMEISNDSLNLIMKKMKEVLTNCGYFSDLSEEHGLQVGRKRKASERAIHSIQLKEGGMDENRIVPNTDPTNNPADNGTSIVKTTKSFAQGPSSRRKQYDKFIQGLKREESESSSSQLIVEESSPAESTQSLPVTEEERKEAFDSWRRDILKRRKLMQEQQHQPEQQLEVS